MLFRSNMLIRSLGRQNKKKVSPDVDALIISLRDGGILTPHLNAKEGAKLVTTWLWKHGAEGISDTAYQKRLERLRRLGLIDKD